MISNKTPISFFLCFAFLFLFLVCIRDFKTKTNNAFSIFKIEKIGEMLFQHRNKHDKILFSRDVQSFNKIDIANRSLVIKIRRGLNEEESEFEDSHRIKCLTEIRNEYRRLVSKHLINRHAILLDTVDHWNLGDSFIQYGEMLLLEEMGSPAEISCSLNNCNHSVVFEHIHSDPRPPVILINGGGNTGDLWRHQSTFKNEILKIYHEYPVVILPQSIHYRRRRNVKRDAVDFARHPNLTFFLRDETSYAFAKMNFPSISAELCSDGAFMIGPIQPKSCVPEYDIVIIARADKERVVLYGSLLLELIKLGREGITYLHTDWKQWESVLSTRIRPINPMLMPKFKVEVGVDMLCKGRVVVTDRLHAMILSTLLGKHHVYLDNISKKISAYRNTHFFSRSNCQNRYLHAHNASSWNDAIDIAKHITRDLK